MKKTDLLFTIILLPLDFIMLVLAAVTAYYLRVGTFVSELRPVIYTITFAEYLSYCILLTFFWLIIFALAGLYKIERKKLLEEIAKIILACSTGILIIIVAIFLKRELFSSRFIILAVWGLSILYVTIGRLIINQIQKILLKKGLGAKKIILIGQDKNTQIIAKEIADNPKFGFKVVKIYNTFSEAEKKEILELRKNEELDEIIQADPNLDRQTILDLINFTEANHIVFKFTADIYRTKTSRLEIDTLAGLPIFEIKKTELEGWGKIYKRIFDLIASALLILFTSPIMLVTAIAIKLDSKGPVFFSKKDDGSALLRVGQYGKPFHYFKFRSMIDKSDSLRYSKALQEQNTRKDSPLVKIKDDPRITRVGLFIRKYSIDELPEFILVFIGKMSLIGPRPHLPEEVAKYQDYHRRVLDIKPGVTGMAQISGRSDLDFEEEIKLDTYYIENWSMWLDMKILFKTPKEVIFPRRQTL